MRSVFGGIAAVFLTISWIGAFAVAGLVENAGWHLVIAEHNVAAGLAVAFLLVAPAFMLTQTVLALPALLFGTIAERTLDPLVDDEEGHAPDQQVPQHQPDRMVGDSDAHAAQTEPVEDAPRDDPSLPP